MDRFQQCQLLKKAYKKERRHALWLWYLLTGLGFAVTLISAVLYADVRFLDGRIAKLIHTALWMPLTAGSGFSPFPRQVELLAHWVILGAGVWTLTFGLILRHVLRKLHRQEAYLGWRTLKTALDTEKEEL